MVLLLSCTNIHWYVDKINSLLEGTNAYEISNLITINKNITSFNKLLKNLVKNENTWTSLIEYPNNPNIIWLTQNPQINPLRPIISSIGSATHKIARAIAKILPPLGTISPSHVIKSGDLLNKIKDINIQNKTRNNLNITSLYINIPIKNASTFLLFTEEKLNSTYHYP